LPGRFAYRDGRKLAEEVRGDIIVIYAEDRKKALELLHHGFLEWLMNKSTAPYRRLINLFITLFEDMQYENKERILQILERLI
jgi:hypothetical protein